MDGLDDGWVFWVVFDALAQLGDVLVEGAAVGQVVEAPGVAEEGVSVKDFAGVLVEDFEQFDVAQAEVDLVVGAVAAEFVGVDFQIADGEGAFFGFGGFLLEAATGDGANAGADFTDAKGFHDVVVGAEFETEDAVDFFGFCADENDGDLVVLFADFAADVVAVHAGQHDVEAGEVGVFGLEEFESGFAVAGADGFVAFAFEDFAESVADVFVVFDNKYFHGFLGMLRDDG